MRAWTSSGSANSCNRRAGARQDRHAGSRQQTRSWDGLLRSQEPRDRAEEAAARQQQAETPQHKAQCAGPAVQVDAKAASKTAASVIARLNVSLAPPPRRSMCHTLANETPFHCNTTATQRVKTSAWTCLTGLPRADCSSADLADVHTWPAFACWQRSDSTLPTKVF